MLTLPVEMDFIDQQNLNWLEEGKNWTATVRWDPQKPGNLAREFWTGRGSCRRVPEDLGVGDFLESAADNKIKGVKGINRKFFRVVTSLADKLVLHQCKKPVKGESSLEEFLDEIKGGLPNPLAPFSTEDLVTEVRRRGLTVTGD